MIIGLGAILPGISGGVLCVVFGIYQPMMEFLAHPIKSFRRLIRLLLPVLIGFVLGFLLLARAVEWMFRMWETAATWLFIGLVAGTLPSLFVEAGQQGRGKGAWIAFGVSTAAMLAWMILLSTTVGAKVQPSFGWWVICGVLWGVGLTVPGLSPSSFFIYFGLYQPMTAGIAALSFDVLVPLALGVALSIVLLARLMRRLLERHYAILFHAILGVVIASTVCIMPFGNAASAGDAVLYGVCFLAGCAAAWGLDRVGKRLDQSSTSGT